MRVKESIKKSGEFWLPHDEGKKVHGTLHIEDGGNITLEVIGVSSGLEDAINSFLKNKDSVDRINGQVEDFGNVSLEHCLYLGGNYGGISKSRYYVHMVVLGVSFNKNEPILINEFKFSVEGLDEWVSINGFDFNYSHEERKATLVYDPPKDWLINLANGMELIISTEWSISSIGKSSIEAKFMEKKYCIIKSNTPFPLDDFVSLAKKITLFFCLAIDQPVGVDGNVKIYSDSVFENGADGRKTLAEMILYYRSVPHSNSVRNIFWFKMLFDFDSVKNVIGSVVNNWIETYDLMEPALNLYFSTKVGDKYLNSVFLSLVQGLETYHRRISDEYVMEKDEFDSLVEDMISVCPEKRKQWLADKMKYGNEVSLRYRLKALMMPYKGCFGSPEERKKIINDIVNTRNYLTHYDQSLKDSAARGNEMFLLCQKMEAIFQLQLLQKLGFSEDYIKSLVGKSGCDLKHKIECK